MHNWRFWLIESAKTKIFCWISTFSSRAYYLSDLQNRIICRRYDTMHAVVVVVVVVVYSVKYDMFCVCIICEVYSL